MTITGLKAKKLQKPDPTGADTHTNQDFQMLDDVIPAVHICIGHSTQSMD